MNINVIIDAIGMIDDNLIADAKGNKSRKKIKQRAFVKGLTVFAAVVLFITAPLPVATACNNEIAYNLLHLIAPAAAQAFKPIQKSCTDNGIKMEVVSAGIDDGTAKICISLKDVEQNRITGEVDLYDSYDVNFPCDTSNHCQFLEYDEKTKTAYLIIYVNRIDGKPLKDGKVTFRFSKLLLNKKRTDGVLSGIDLKDVPLNPETINEINFRGGSAGIGYDRDDIEELYSNDCYYKSRKYLKPVSTPICVPTDGVSVMGIGYIDNALHIQSYFEDISHTDNHGFISLADKNGEECETYKYVTISFWDEQEKGCYEETIIDIPYDEVKNYRLYGDLVTSSGYMEGNWQVTFSLDKLIAETSGQN